jgi:hypothetical protein
VCCGSCVPAALLHDPQAQIEALKAEDHIRSLHLAQVGSRVMHTLCPSSDTLSSAAGSCVSPIIFILPFCAHACPFPLPLCPLQVRSELSTARTEVERLRDKATHLDEANVRLQVRRSHVEPAWVAELVHKN